MIQDESTTPPEPAATTSDDQGAGGDILLLAEPMSVALATEPGQTRFMPGRGGLSSTGRFPPAPDGDVIFFSAQGGDLVRFAHTGDVFIRGERVDDNPTIYAAIKDWLAVGEVWRVSSELPADGVVLVVSPTGRLQAIEQHARALLAGWDESPRDAGSGLEASFYDELESLRRALEAR